MNCHTTVRIVSELHGFDSADLDSLETSLPPDLADFGIYIEATVGIKGDHGGDLFGVTVCTPSWLARQVPPGSYLFARHYLIVERYDFQLIQRAMHKMFNGVQGTSWDEVALRLARWGYWEFEDLQDAPPVM